MADNVVQCRSALQQYPGHMSLGNLAIGRLIRGLRRRILVEPIDVNRAILALRPPGHPDRFIALNNLAIRLAARFERLAVPSDQDEAIEHFRAALAIFPTDRPDRSAPLDCLASALHDRFQRRGILSDLNEAVDLRRAVLAFRPPGHLHRFITIKRLIGSLMTRFKRQARLSDLDEAIKLFRAALVILPPGDPGRFDCLYYFAAVLQERYKQRGALADIVEAIDLHRAALASCPPCHPRRLCSLRDLAASLTARFEQQSVLSDLDEAIELHRAILANCHPNDSSRFYCLYFLAVALQDRFEWQHAQSDLDEAIKLYQAALSLCLSGRFLHPNLLKKLAWSLLHRFKLGAVLFDLDEAIRFCRVALALCPPGHAGRFDSLFRLTNTLLARFAERGVLSDLDEAVDLNRAALALCPIGHPSRFTHLNNLAYSLTIRFKQRGVQFDQDEVVWLLRDALVLCPPSHPLRSGLLYNLANSLCERFQQRGVQSDIDEAIDRRRAAVELCTLSHPDRFAVLYNLAWSLEARFKPQGVQSDLDEAIELRRDALVLCPPGHFYRSMSIGTLALDLQHRFKLQGLSSDLDEAFSFYLQLSRLSHPVSRSDICAAESWIASAEQVKHGSALVAYKTMLKFLNQYVAVLASSSNYFDVIKKATSSIAMDAFSCCVRRGALTTAVELVEQGRAILWTQSVCFRRPLDELSASSATGKALAEEFKKLSLSLRDVFHALTEDQSSQNRQLTTQWADVVCRIRQLPDFSRFLLPPLFSDLQKAAEYGPVIIVNGSKYGCDALIITRDQDPILIPLDTSLAEVSELSSEFQSLIDRVGCSDHRLESHKIVGILRKLWTRIVGPVVRVLEELIDPGSRIWWCPTAEFTLLPLHAAGPYAKKCHNLSHFYVSSYTPTLAALIRARQRVSQDASVQHFLAVGQANPDGGKELRCVTAELDIVAERVSPVLSFTSLSDIDATVQGASDACSRNQLLHLACHGMPNRKQPFKSSFAMRDGPFTINDIIQSRVQNPEFAFLSACHATVGDESSANEAIHLAAAMHFLGFCSVIGSLWSVDDEVARQVVTAFYDNLFDSPGRLNCRRAAVALHKAVKSLRKKISLEQQIAFVHIGV
ncbi:TPR-like protein [Suillus lakei]|nr:TPR-like protein [Suillus lakei]